MKKYWENGALKLSENRRYFVNGEEPFFLLADTAWSLFQKLDEAQARVYLRNRKEKGFNTIYAVLVNFQNTEASAFDLKEDKDILEVLTDQVYWKKIKNIVSIAEDLGIYMGLLPVWGNVVVNKNLRTDNMETYISFIPSLKSPVNF